MILHSLAIDVERFEVTSKARRRVKQHGNIFDDLYGNILVDLSIALSIVLLVFIIRDSSSMLF